VTTAPARWERCLARPRAQLLPMPGASDRLGVFPDGDRRRRPLARLDKAQTQQAISEGRLETDGDTYRQTEAGRLAVKRERSGFNNQHRVLALREIIDRTGRVSRVFTNTRESPVGRWAHFLTPAQINAAERFIADYHRSTLTPSVTRNWSLDAQVRAPGRGEGVETGALGRMEATRRIMRLLDGLGRRDGEIVTAALIREDSLAALGRCYAGNPRGGRQVVASALDRLVAVTSLPQPPGCD